MLCHLLLLVVVAKEALGCARHLNHHRHPHLGRRQTITTNPGRAETDWRYEASFNWGLVNAGEFFVPLYHISGSSHSLWSSADRL